MYERAAVHQYFITQYLVMELDDGVVDTCMIMSLLDYLRSQLNI